MKEHVTCEAYSKRASYYEGWRSLNGLAKYRQLVQKKKRVRITKCRCAICRAFACESSTWND